MENKISAIPQKVDGFFILGILLTVYMVYLGNKMNPFLSGIALFGFLCLIIRPKHLIGPLLFATLFDDVLLVFGDQSFSRFLNIFLIIGITVNVWHTRTCKLAEETLLFFFLILMGLAFSLHGIMGYTSFPLTYVFGLVLAIFLVNFHSVSSVELSEILYRYALLALIYFLYFIFSAGLDVLVYSNRNYINGVNVNQIAFGVAITGSIIFGHFVMTGFKEKYIHIFALLIAFVCLCMTGSRSALIAYVVSSILTLVIYSRSNFKVKKIIGVGFALALFLGCIYAYLYSQFPLLMERFTVGDVIASGGSHRLYVWEIFFEHYLPSHWLFGIGFDPNNMYYAVAKYWEIGHSAHNFIIEMLSATGVFGLAIYLGCFCRWLFLFVKSSRNNVYVLVPFAMLVCIFIDGIGEEILKDKMLWLSIGFCFISMNSVRKWN